MASQSVIDGRMEQAEVAGNYEGVKQGRGWVLKLRRGTGIYIILYEVEVCCYLFVRALIKFTHFPIQK